MPQVYIRERVARALVKHHGTDQSLSDIVNEILAAQLSDETPSD